MQYQRSDGPRWLYLHGFASGPRSQKARAFTGWAEGHGLSLACLDLRRPSFEHLRLSAMIRATREALSAGSARPERERAALIGSSLGGLTACRVAEEDARVSALFLMAPAFRLAERWPARLGAEAFRAWQETGFLEVDDHTTGGRARVDHGFYEEMVRLDAGDGGLPDVRVPTLIVHGVRDQVVDVEVSRELARRKRNVRLVELDDDHALTASIDRILAEATAFFRPLLGVGGAQSTR